MNGFAPIGALDTAVIAAYLAGMLAVGVFVARRVRNFDDFFVAGRRMTTPVLVCTLVSTYYGLDVTFGTSETAYHSGVSAFFAYSAPFYAAYAVTALLVAPRLARLPVRSLPEAVAHCYGRSAGLAAALASFVYSAPILGVAGMGLIGQALFGWDPLVAAASGAAIALVYTLLGGLWADVLTDTVQFTIMCVSIAIAAAIALTRFGGPTALGERLAPELLEPLGALSGAELIVFGSIALTPLVEPAFYQRIFAARSVLSVRRALLIGLVLWAAYDWLVVYLALVGRDMVASGVLAADTDPSAILLSVCAALLPAGLFGLFIAGLLASAMSTIDSYTLVAAGNLVYDGYRPFAKRPPADRTLLAATRVAAVVTLGAALFLALRFERLRDAWIFMATILLSTVLVPMCAALFLRRSPPPRAGAWAAWAGLSVSALLFVAMEGFGHFDAERETLVLAWTAATGELRFSLSREEAVFLALPASVLAFVLGWITSRGGPVPAAATAPDSQPGPRA